MIKPLLEKMPSIYQNYNLLKATLLQNLPALRLITSEAEFNQLLIARVIAPSKIQITMENKDNKRVTTQACSFVNQHSKITPMFIDHLIYFGFSMRDGTSGFFEMFRFAMDSQGPAFRKKTETRSLTPKTSLTWASNRLCCTKPASRIMRGAWKECCRHTSGTSGTGCGVRGGRAATTRVSDTSRNDAAATAVAVLPPTRL